MKRTQHMKERKRKKKESKTWKILFTGSKSKGLPLQTGWLILPLQTGWWDLQGFISVLYNSCQFTANETPEKIMWLFKIWWQNSTYNYLIISGLFYRLSPQTETRLGERLWTFARNIHYTFLNSTEHIQKGNFMAEVEQESRAEVYHQCCTPMPQSPVASSTSHSIQHFKLLWYSELLLQQLKSHWDCKSWEIPSCSQENEGFI